MITSESEAQRTTSDSSATSLDFNLETLRLWVAVVAHLLPPLVFIITLTLTSSISASYYTKARDVFVGSLFVIGALFWAYNGHPEPKFSEKKEGKIEKLAGQVGGFPQRVVSIIANALYRIVQALYKLPESLVSKVAGAAAVVAALCPTACDFCKTDTKSIIHYVAATILFSAIVYFCLIAFPYQAKSKVKEQENKNVKLQGDGEEEALGTIHAPDEMQMKQKRRAGFYVGCGLVIAGIMLALVVAQFTLREETRVALHITYIAETAALELFGFAWLIATKALPFFAHESERYYPFGKRVPREKRQPMPTSA